MYENVNVNLSYLVISQWNINMEVVRMIHTWLENLVTFEKLRDVNNTLDSKIVPKSDHKVEDAHVLVVEGFLLYT